MCGEEVILGCTPTQPWTVSVESPSAKIVRIDAESFCNHLAEYGQCLDHNYNNNNFGCPSNNKKKRKEKSLDVI
jgi:hypothetical protein